MLRSNHGFSLVELLILIVVVGLMAAVAMKSMTVAVEDTRRSQTERKLEAVAHAIVGDPEKMHDGTRSDFGYVGDVGAFPANLSALYTNPGYSTWKGPYISTGITQDSTSYRKDAWGRDLTYSGGVVVSSTGNGTAINKRLADSSADYLLNSVSGMIRDKNDSVPGGIYPDSVQILVDIPNGSGGTTTRMYHPQSSGAFLLDSVPAGNRFFRFVYSPANDTIRKYYTVLPRHLGDPELEVRFSMPYFAIGGGGGGCTGTDSMILRPDGDGALTNNTDQSGCVSHWQCVDESVADDASTQIINCSNNWRTDVYSMSAPSASSCQVGSVTVYCRAIRDHTQGNIEPTLYVGGTEYNSSSMALTNSWAEYSYTWSTNPNTGGLWSWTDVANLHAGARFKGQNSNFCARLTQVWVVVKY